MRKQPTEIEFEVANGERVRISGEGLGEPEKSLIVERALEIAAIENRPNQANRYDYEEAARELSTDAKLMERGDLDVLEAPEARDPSEVTDQSSGQKPSVEAPDEADAARQLVEDGVDQADHEQMLEGRTNRGDLGGRYAGGNK